MLDSLFKFTWFYYFSKQKKGLILYCAKFGWNFLGDQNHYLFVFEALIKEIFKIEDQNKLIK